MQDRVGGAEFDEAAEIHDRDAVADMRDHGEVVADEDIGQPEVALQIGEQVEHVGLDRDIERGDDLVADDQAGRSARARAMLTRCFWPPESSCG